MTRNGKPKGREQWAFTCRAGLEDQVVIELGEKAQILAEGVVLVDGRPRTVHHVPIVPVFATQAMHTDGRKHAPDPDRLAEVMADALVRAIGPRDAGPIPTWALAVLTPSSRRPRDPRRRVAAAIDEAIAPILDRKLARAVADRYVDDAREAQLVVQAWVVAEDAVLVGATLGEDMITRTVPELAELDEARGTLRARSSLKLEEALEWLGIEPGPGEVCVDLGSGVGAWSAVLAGRGAKVIAVDRKPPRLDAEASVKIVHALVAPFTYVPDETADWVVIHLAARPQDVAQLVAKWGRRAWARHVVANFLLPMKQKVEVVRDVIAVLEDAGWRGIKARQLLSDGDEITVYAWLDPKLATRGPQEPFRMRSEGAERARRDRAEGRDTPPPVRAEKPNRRMEPRVEDLEAVDGRRAQYARVRSARAKAARGADEARPKAERAARPERATRPERGAARPERATRPERGAARPERATRPERGAARPERATRPERGAARPERATRPERAEARPERRTTTPRAREFLADDGAHATGVPLWTTLASKKKRAPADEAAPRGRAGGRARGAAPRPRGRSGAPTGGRASGPRRPAPRGGR